MECLCLVRIVKVIVEDVSLLRGELSVLGELREGETITASLRDEDGLVLGETVSFELFTVEGEEEESVSMQEIEVMDVDVVEAIFVLDSEGIGGKEILLKAVYTDGEGTIYDGGSDNEAIVVSEIYEVENVNDAPVIDVLADVSVDEGNVEIPVLASVSDEEGDSLSFSIDASRDGDLFSVDEGTGKLRFKEGADYEMAMDVGADNVYEVLLTASDGEDASSEVLSVTVSDVSTGDGELELMGDVEEGGTITASLNDEDGLASGVTVTFELFSVEGETETSILVEEVEMSAVGNRASANFVLDGDGIEGKEIIVKAMYADAGGNSEDLVSEMYTVEDGDDAPVIEVFEDLTLDEREVLYPFKVITATDEEGGSLTFSIDTSLDGNFFSIDSITGELKFFEAPSYESAVNAEDNMFEILLTASDGYLESSEVVNITVIDLDMTVGILDITGGAEQGGTVSATLVDEDGFAYGGTISLNLFMLEEDGAESLLSTQTVEISPIDGAEIVRVNFEALSDGQDIVGKEILVKAVYTDREGNVYDGGSDNFPVLVSEVEIVEDVNDAPSIMTSLSVEENFIGIIGDLAVDVDGDDLSYNFSLSGANDIFEISEEGELSIFVAQDYEDASNRTYRFNVTASDGEEDVSATVTVTVENVMSGDGILKLLGDVEEGGTITASLNDEDGLANGATISFELMNGSTVLATQEITVGTAGNTASAVFTISSEEDLVGEELKIKASYTDVGTNVEVEELSIGEVSAVNDLPSIVGTVTVDENFVGVIATEMATDAEGDELRYSLSGGDLFSIDEMTGELSALSALNFEEEATHTVTVTVNDGTGASNQEVVISVNDVDEKPLIREESYTVDEGFTDILSLDVDDNGEGDVSFVISGTDASLFSYDASTGELKFTAAPDYESAADEDTDNVYELLLTVSDATAANAVSSAIMITVNDVNDVAPVIGILDALESVMEGEEAVVGTLLVEDGDTEKEMLTFSVSGDKFRIDGGGVLRALGLDYEDTTEVVGGTTMVTVSVSDGVETVSKTFEITVEDKTGGKGNLWFSGRVMQGKEVEVVLNDEDGLSGVTVMFELLDSDGVALARLNADGTKILDADGEEVTVLEVSDGVGARAVGRFYVPFEQERVGEELRVKAVYTDEGGNAEEEESELRMIEDSNDAPMIEDQVFEGILENEVSFGRRIMASDVDGDDLMYSVGDSRLSIEEDTGLLVLTTALDYEEGESQEFLVTVSDGELSSSATISLMLEDADDDEVIGGIGINRRDFSSWHDASVAGSFVDSRGNGVSDGGRVHRWLDLSGNNNHLTQGSSNNQGRYQGGVMRYELDGVTSYNYAREARATTSLGLTSFSVVKVKDIPTDIDANFLFGSNDEYRYHGGRDGKIFSSHSRISELLVDGKSVGLNDAEWAINEDQIIYIRSQRDVEVKIKTLSKDRDGSNPRSIRGDISEVIVLKKDLTDAQEVIINNYLGAKWGVDLVSGDYYEGDMSSYGGYDKEVSGLIKLSDSEVLKTREFGGLKISNSETGGAITDAGDGFFMGHNGGKGLGRIWYGDFTDASGGTTGGVIDLSFSVRELGLEIGTSYQLVSGNELSAGVEASGEYIIFAGVSVVDGLYRLVVDGENVQPLLSKVEFSIDENDAGDLGSLEAFDTDTLLYSISGADVDLFNFDADTRVLSFISPPDYEAAGDADVDNVYELVVTVDDGQGESNSVSSASVQVFVNNINESPVVEMTTTPALRFDENIEAAITTITAVDPEGVTIVYSVSDNSNFRVDSQGVLRLKSGGLDYESMAGRTNETATIEVIVTASDGVAANNITESFRVTIDDVGPVFNSAGTFMMAENLTGSLGILTATDSGGSINYSVNDTNFSINVSTGELFLREAQNYEALGTDKYLTTTVTANGSDNETATIEVRVNIENVNEAPVIVETFEVVENQAETILVLSDEDSTFTQTKSGADASFFTASVSNGELSFAMTAKDYENAQDADGDNVYEFSVVVNFADSQANSNLNVKVTINDVDDDEVIAGIGFNREILSSWHDASVAESFVDGSDNPVSDGEKFRRWQDQSGNGNTLWQGNANNQAKYEDGVMRYELDGGTSYQYSNDAQATTSLGLTTFSVLKIKDIPTSSDANFLFGSPDEYRYHGGRNGKIFSSNALMSEVRVDGELRSVGGSNAAEWEENETQVIYTRSNRDVEVKIGTLSKDRAGNDRSIRGDISEVIVFKGELNSAEEVIINNYLGAKWDVDLVSDDYYDGDTRINGDYDNDVSGLVKLSDSEVLRTREMGGLRLLNNEGDGAIADDGDAFFVGHNDESGLSRVWYGDFTDASGKTGGKVDFIFSVSEFGLTAGTTYILSLHHQGGGYNSEIEGIAGSDEIVFNGFELPDGFVVFYLVGEIDNRRPIFKQYEFSVDENSTAVTDFSVYDDNSTGHSYTIGGTDALLFNLTSSGTLSFRSAPDFEAAGDGDGDNVYEIIVTVNDGASSNNINSASIAVIVEDLANVQHDGTTGADTLTALATQEDTFVFDEASESVSGGTTTLNADSIAGFANEDKIDLSHFSIASTDVLLAQTSGITDFGDTTAKVYVHKSSSDSIVYVNTDSDDNVELKITVSGFDLGLDDFIL